MPDRIAQLQTMLEADPDDTFCLYGLAMEHAKRGNHAQAVETFDRLLRIDPDYCYAYFHKAKSQESDDNSPGAIATLRAGLARAKAINDAKAASEIASYLDELS